MEGSGQTIFPNVFPVRRILESKIRFRDLGQKDIEIVIVDLNAANGIKAWSLFGGGFGKK